MKGQSLQDLYMTEINPTNSIISAGVNSGPNQVDKNLAPLPRLASHVWS
jgi:hypothetical protein